MLPKNYRIQKKNDISSLLKSRRRLSSQHFGIQFNSTQVPNFRLLVVVSKKISKKAVTRNLIRRRIQSVFGELKSVGRLPASLDCAIVVRQPKIQELKWEALKDEVILACRQLMSRL